MITITEAAASHLHALLKSKGASPDEQGLRLYVERGGCAGMSYAMAVGEPQATDIAVEKDGVRVYIDADSQEYLSGVQLDYEDALNDSGFKIENPNAARSCGCGTSFEPTKEDKEPEFDPETMSGSVCGGDS